MLQLVYNTYALVFQEISFLISGCLTVRVSGRRRTTIQRREQRRRF
jgi:hypothetical protein